MTSRVASALVVAVCTLSLTAACRRGARALSKPGASVAPVASVAPAPAASTAPLPASAFHIVVRAPMPEGRRYPIEYFGHAFPLVQRLPGGGLVVGSEYARAWADGPGPLRVELVYQGFENDAFHLKHPGRQPIDHAIRWLWASGPEATFAVDEVVLIRGPEVSEAFRLRDGRWQSPRPVHYEAVAARGPSVLALERPSGGGSPAKLVLLTGTGPVPPLPRGFCPITMSAAPDGTLLVLGAPCKDAAEFSFHVLRFAGTGAQATVEILAPDASDEHTSFQGPVALAVSSDELWIGTASLLLRWDGKSWTRTQPFGPGVHISSLSRGRTGALWAVVQSGDLEELTTRLFTRASATSEWTAVLLPEAPLDRLDPEEWSAYATSAYTRAPVDPNPTARVHAPMLPLRVDADGDDVIVLAHVEEEAFVLSTRARGEVTRVPSQNLQRVQIARVARRRLARSVADCDVGMLVFPEDTSKDELSRARSLVLSEGGESTVEGARRLVIHGSTEDLLVDLKKLASFKPRLLCGPAVIEH